MKERTAGWLTSLSAKYIVLFVLLVGVPVVATSVYLLYSSYQDNKRALIGLQEAKARALAEQVGQSLTDVVNRLEAIHASDLSAAERELVLRPLLLTEPEPTDVFYLDAHNRHVTTLGASQSDGGTRLTLPTLSEKAFEEASSYLYISPLFQLHDPEGFAASALIVAVPENMGSGGVIGERLYAQIFEELIGGTHFGKSGYAYAVDSNGRAITYPRGIPIRSKGEAQVAAAAVKRLPQVADALRSAADNGSATGRSFRKQDVLTAWAMVKPAGWRVFVEQPESAAFAPLKGKIWRTALLLAAFIVGAVVMSVLLARRLVDPIRRMRLAAARIGAGAYDERIELERPRTVAIRGRPTGHTHQERVRSIVAIEPVRDHHRQDDLGALADDFNRMAASLQESHAKLEQKVEERTFELQAALEQLAEKTRELEIASKHKSEFLANMSHELRTPLNAIIGFSQVLKQDLFGPVNAKQEEYLDDILSSADHLLSLINDILDLSKVEAGQVELEVAPFSLREALERGVVMVRERAIKNGIDLDLDVDPGVGVVEADERRIRQVVFNLLSNAVKFTPTGGRIDVSVAQQNGYVTVAVTDDGPGIAPEDQERIFEEFQQAEHEAPRPEGTGLGLALSRRLVELHGGHIWVESQPGAGSTFAFTIPLKSR